MKYIWGYLALFGFNILMSCVVYVWFPTYRHYLVQEDSLIENLSAAFFLLSCFLALLLLKKRKGHKKLLLLVSVLGLIGFLDEISFGERISGFSMPHIAGVKIDAVHDFFFLAYKYKAYAYTLAGTGIILFIAFARPWLKLMMPSPNELRQPHYVLLFFFAVSVFIALVLDLDLIDYNPLVMLEELLEMNAGIALCFCSLSLPNVRVERRAASRRRRSRTRG